MDISRWLPALALLSFGACARHVNLVVPGTSPGARYVCNGTGCTPATVIDPARSNELGTRTLVLPEQCHGHIHQVLLRSAQSKQPEAEVTCAPTETAGVGEM